MKILEIITESKTQKAKAPKPPNFVAKHAMKTTSGAGAHTNAKKAAKDVRGQKHKAMAEGIVDVVKKKVSGLTGYKVKVSPDDQVWIAGTTTGYFTGSNSREREQQTLEKLSNELKKQGINTSGIKYTDMHDFTGDKYPPAWFIKVVKGQAETVLDMLKNNKIPGFAAASPSLSYPSGKSPTYRHSQDGLGGNPKESRKQGVTEAPDQSTAISQEQLNQMYAKGKPMMFIKNIPVALVPLAKINQIGTPQQVRQVQKALGSVDQTSYTDEYKNKGYVVFQWNGTALDLYVASPEVVAQKYVKFNGQLPQDDKSRGKIPSLIALGKLGIDPSKVPFFVKKVPTQMVSAKQLGLEGKTIQTSWGEQTVSPGGFMVREENGHIYTVAPDAKGLPIGYLRVQESVGEGFGGNDTVQSLVNIRSTVKQILIGKAQYPQGFASQLEIALYDAINALRDNPEQGARNTVNELAELRAIAKQVQTGKATFPQGYTSRLEWVLYDAIKQIENSSQRVAEDFSAPPQDTTGHGDHIRQTSGGNRNVYRLSQLLRDPSVESYLKIEVPHVSTPSKELIQGIKSKKWEGVNGGRSSIDGPGGWFLTAKNPMYFKEFLQALSQSVSGDKQIRVGIDPYVKNARAQQGMAEGKKPDNYHIVNKDGKPASLASYADKTSAEKDRDAKHPGAEVRQVGPRGKVKGVSEDGEGGASVGSTNAAMVGVGAVYKNKRAKKQKPGTNALDMKGVNLLTGGSIKR